MIEETIQVTKSNWDYICEQVNLLTKENIRLRVALEEISKSPHEGQGFCYGVYGLRDCHCHKSIALEAIGVRE